MIEKIKLVLKQWWCRHEGRYTTFETGDRCIITHTICTVCGKNVEPHNPEATYGESLELLREHFSEAKESSPTLDANEQIESSK